MNAVRRPVCLTNSPYPQVPATGRPQELARRAAFPNIALL